MKCDQQYLHPEGWLRGFKCSYSGPGNVGHYNQPTSNDQLGALDDFIPIFSISKQFFITVTKQQNINTELKLQYPPPASYSLLQTHADHNFVGMALLTLGLSLHPRDLLLGVRQHRPENIVQSPLESVLEIIQNCG